jgi:hypothetical protein
MHRIARSLLVSAAALPLALGVGIPLAHADSDNARAGFGSLYYEDMTVRTVLTPTAMPGRGVDAIYAFPGMEQRAVTSVAPGDPGYHGGRWAVHTVSWNHGVEPYLLTSDDAVLAAEAAGHVTIERVEAADFVCPVAGKGGTHG